MAGAVRTEIHMASVIPNIHILHTESVHIPSAKFGDTTPRISLNVYRSSGGIYVFNFQENMKQNSELCLFLCGFLSYSYTTKKVATCYCEKALHL
jgi:hypothetical protein